MIDGVKLLCNLPPTLWTNNKNLSFRAWTDTTTGEVTSNNRHADTDGLHLSIIEGYTGIFCNLKGSLPKYYTKGETNAIDYPNSEFLATCDLLNENIKVSPQNTKLRGFEFGVNINLPCDITEIYEGLKSYKGHICGINEINGKRNGLRFDFQQYRVKIYDKGLQDTGKKSRLMRFEIVVKKMEWVRHLGLKTLADLQSKAVWVELSKIILQVWEDTIFITRDMMYKGMTLHKQKKFLRWLDIHYWANLNRNQYHKAKRDLSNLQNLYGRRDHTKQRIYDLILEKCLKLTAETPEERAEFLPQMLGKKHATPETEKEQQNEGANWRQFNHLDKGLESVSFSPHILTQNKSKKTLQEIKTESKKKKPKKCKCMNCKKELKEKKASAKFCGVQCKNQYHGKKRTKALQKSRAKEIKNLDYLLTKIEKGKLWLSVTYRDNGADFNDVLHQDEIITTRETIRQIRAVSVSRNEDMTNPITLTTLRAKKLIRAINDLNHKNHPTPKTKIGDNLTKSKNTKQ